MRAAGISRPRRSPSPRDLASGEACRGPRRGDVKPVDAGAALAMNARGGEHMRCLERREIAWTICCSQFAERATAPLHPRVASCSRAMPPGLVAVLVAVLAAVLARGRPAHVRSCGVLRRSDREGVATAAREADEITTGSPRRGGHDRRRRLAVALLHPLLCSPSARHAPQRPSRDPLLMASDGNEYDADSPHGLPRGSVQQRGSPGDWREISSSASRPAARRRRNIGPQARGRASTLASINTSGSGSTNTRTNPNTNTSNNTSIHTEANSPLPPINTILRPERNLAVVFPVTATYHSQHSSHERNWPDDSGPRCSSLAAPVVTPHYSQCYGRVRSGLDSELSRYSQKRAPRPAPLGTLEIDIKPSSLARRASAPTRVGRHLAQLPIHLVQEGARAFPAEGRIRGRPVRRHHVATKIRKPASDEPSTTASRRPGEIDRALSTGRQPRAGRVDQEREERAQQRGTSRRAFLIAGRPLLRRGLLVRDPDERGARLGEALLSKPSQRCSMRASTLLAPS
ncbi:unnamed protein product [Diplocarpon coronariae]